MSGFEVLNSGIFTTIQDKGRFGFTSLGVTNSGVMDEFSYYIANSFLDNDFDTNCLEIAFSGLKLKAFGDTMICVTGADISFSINDIPHNPWQTFKIYKNDILKFSKNISGQRAYLIVKDGFLIQKEFKSNSTTLKEQLGGLNGIALKKGDFLPFKSVNYTFTKRLKKIYQPDYSDDLTLRVVLGYQEDTFSKKEKDKFFSNDFIVTNDINRMAVKLDGVKIISNIDGIVSEGICFGAIQITKDGKPIILLKERQTIGGYPKIGSVLACDCFKLSQAKPNTKVNFQLISLEEAVEKMKEFYNSF